jgi:hypothetical protein
MDVYLLDEPENSESVWGQHVKYYVEHDKSSPSPDSAWRVRAAGNLGGNVIIIASASSLARLLCVKWVRTLRIASLLDVNTGHLLD